MKKLVCFIWIKLYITTSFAQQTVYWRNEASNGNWQNGGSPCAEIGTVPSQWWYLGFSPNNARNAPDCFDGSTTRHNLIIDNNSHVNMIINEKFYAIRSLTLQSTATSNRTFSGDPDNNSRGIAITTHITNEGPSGTDHTFNTFIAIDANPCTLVTSNGGATTIFNREIYGNTNNIYFGGNGTTEVNATISGTGSVYKIGNGTLIITGECTYSGTTTVEAGTLRLNRSGGGTLPNTANVTVNGGTLRISTNQTLNNLTIASGAQVEVDEGAVLEVTGTLSNSGTITLKASSSGVGQLIHNSAASGQVVTSQYITGLSTEGRWIYLGSPTSSARLDSLIEGSATMVAANSNQGTIWNWDATNGQWSAPASISDNFVVGRGYVTWIGMNGSYGPFTRVLPGKIDVYGSVTSGASDFSISLTYGGTSPNDGWNLIANPWPATYDWNGQTIGSSHFNVWVYRDGSYKTFNTDGTGDPEARYWTPMQAGFVRRDNLGPSSISFERTRRITSQNILLSKPQSGKSEVNILVKNNSTDKEDNLYITFSQGGNEQYLLSEDAEKKMNTNNYPNIFTYREGRKLIINQLPELSGYRSEPVGFQGTQAGTYTISIKNKDNFDPSISVLLEDKIMNNFALLNNADYTFVHNPVNNPDRFVLHFNKSQIGTPEMEANKFNAWVYDGVAYIRGLEHLGLSTVKISDLSGRIIASYRIDIASGSTNEIVLPSLPKGVYLLSVESVAQSKTVKFIYY